MDEKDRFLELVRGLFLAGTLTGDQCEAVREAGLDMANQFYWKGRKHERMTWVSDGGQLTVGQVQDILVGVGEP